MSLARRVTTAHTSRRWTHNNLLSGKVRTQMQPCHPHAHRLHRPWAVNIAHDRLIIQTSLSRSKEIRSTIQAWRTSSPLQLQIWPSTRTSKSSKQYFPNKPKIKSTGRTMAATRSCRNIHAASSLIIKATVVDQSRMSSWSQRIVSGTILLASSWRKLRKHTTSMSATTRLIMCRQPAINLNRENQCTPRQNLQWTQILLRPLEDGRNQLGVLVACPGSVKFDLLINISDIINSF